MYFFKKNLYLLNEIKLYEKVWFALITFPSGLLGQENNFLTLKVLVLQFQLKQQF